MERLVKVRAVNYGGVASQQGPPPSRRCMPTGENEGMILQSDVTSTSANVACVPRTVVCMVVRLCPLVRNRKYEERKREERRRKETYIDVSARARPAAVTQLMCGREAGR